MNGITLFDKKYLTIANIYSFMAIILWVYSILLIIKWDYTGSFNFILLWVICDMLDGYFARKYKTVSSFWKILDNFADVLLYVFSVIFLYFSLHNITPLGWCIMGGFLLGSVYRLAYFFEWGFTEKWSHLYYSWMPVYFHLILFLVIIQVENIVIQNICIVVFSLLMITRIPFRKFWLIVGLIYIWSFFIINNAQFLWLF